MATSYDEAWLRQRGYILEGDTARRLRQERPPQAEEDIPEGTLLAKVRRCALDNGFLFYHTYSSRKSDVGYPDCTLTKPGRPLYIWELKSTHGQVTIEQERWYQFLSLATSIEPAIYRPQHWPLIEAILTGRSPQ